MTSSDSNEGETVDSRKRPSDASLNKALSLKDYDMWALGITIVIGGQYFAWNAALSAGFGSFFIATCIIASGYGCLILCIAELSSGLPFAGGSYGLARVTAGIYPGYMVACFDSMESVIYVATSAISIGQMLSYVFGTGRNWEPLYWFLFYGTALFIHCWGGLTFWRINMAMALVSFFIVLLYIFGSAHWGNFDSYAKLEDESGHSAWFHGGGSEFMRVLPIPSWFFVGVESINLACQDITEPKKNIPRGYLACISTLLLTCCGVLFVAVSLPPGIEALEDQLNPFNAGFRLLLKCSDQVATLLAMPALYATAFGFMFCYGRQLRSMGNSGLVPLFLGKSHPTRGTPGRALVAGSLVGLCVCGIVFLFPVVGNELFNICMLGAFSAYFAQFISYIVFNSLLCNIQREFRSPLGIIGAVYGYCVFMMAFIAIAFFQDNYIAIFVYTMYAIGVTIYYYVVVMRRQFFSDEEKAILMTAHVVKNNVTKQRRRERKETVWGKVILWLASKVPSKRSSGGTRGNESAVRSKWSGGVDSFDDALEKQEESEIGSRVGSDEGMEGGVTDFDISTSHRVLANTVTNPEAQQGRDNVQKRAMPLVIRGESVNDLIGHPHGDLRLPMGLEGEADPMESFRGMASAASISLRQFRNSEYAPVHPELVSSG